jgi:hypothetical protein
MTKVHPCFFSNTTHPSTLKLTYQLPNHPTKTNYYLCGEHAPQFSTTHLIQTTTIKREA